MLRTVLSVVLGGALVLSGASRAEADGLEPPPAFCPPGSTPFSDHGGTGCMWEPPDDCPEGYVPRASTEVAYCEPPPATACPTGSEPGSTGPDQPSCNLLGHCERERDCESDTARSCRPTGLCVDPSALPGGDPRFSDWRAYGACETNSDCETGRVCDTSPRCDPDVDRVDPEGRTLPAIIRPVPSVVAAASSAVAVARTSSAWFMAGGAAAIAIVLVVLVRKRAKKRR